MRKFAKNVSVWAKKQAKTVSGISTGVIVGLAGTAVVVAAIPDAGGVYHACYRTATGALKLIDNAVDSCAANESPAQWNQTGPQGAPGADGADGAPGEQGPPGPPGADGDGNVLIPSLVGADLRNANFVGWDLAGRDFTNANLRLAVLTGANLAGANFTGANFSSTGFQGVNLSNNVMAGATFTLNRFLESNFSGANLSGAKFLTTTTAGGGGNFDGYFVGANFTGATISTNWLATDFGGGTFTYAPNFTNANFTNVNFTPIAGGTGNMRIERSNFTGANFTGVQFNGTPSRLVVFALSNLTGVDLSAANVANVSFQNTTCPDGTNSDTNGGTCVGHLAP